MPAPAVAGMAGPAEWEITEVVASPADLHRELPGVDRRRVRVATATGPALVLGSTQDPSTVDRAALAARGAVLVQRRTGGGAVWVSPDDPLWIDIAVPADDPLHDDDVVRSFAWLGHCWLEALTAVGLTATIHQGPADRDPRARAVCFAGRGPGEVSVDGHKVVGLAQRRGRGGAVFQCAVNRSFDPLPLLEALGRTGDRRLADALPGRGTGVPHTRLLAAFLAALP